MSVFRSDLQNTSFINFPANAVVEQYVHDLTVVLDNHVPLVSRLTNKDSLDWLYDANLKELEEGPKIY